MVDPLRISEFEKFIRKCWPAFPANNRSPASPVYAGTRPKLCTARIDEADLMIYKLTHTGVDGLFVLRGIESLGLTSSLSLISEAVDQIEKAH